MAGLFNPSSHDAREMIRGIISQTFALRITTYLLNGVDRCRQHYISLHRLMPVEPSRSLSLAHFSISSPPQPGPLHPSPSVLLSHLSRVSAIDTIHRKSLDILASSISLMGFVSITDSPDPYQGRDSSLVAAVQEEGDIPSRGHRRDQNFLVSLNADFILRPRCPKIPRPTLFVDKPIARF